MNILPPVKKHSLEPLLAMIVSRTTRLTGAPPPPGPPSSPSSVYATIAPPEPVDWLPLKVRVGNHEGIVQREDRAAGIGAVVGSAR